MVCEKKSFENTNKFSILLNYPPLIRAWSFCKTNLNHLYPSKHCVKHIWSDDNLFSIDIDIFYIHTVCVISILLCSYLFENSHQPQEALLYSLVVFFHPLSALYEYYLKEIVLHQVFKKNSKYAKFIKKKCFKQYSIELFISKEGLCALHSFFTN